MSDVTGVRLALVVLAAGTSKRYGTAKQLANYRGRPLLQHAIDACVGLSKFPCYVVLGANRLQIFDHIEFADCDTLINEGWAEGIGGSIRYAAQRLGDQYDALLFLAADQVKIDSAQLQALIEAWQSDPDKIACAVYGEQLGIPAIFPQSYYSDLLELKGDTGGKKILLRNSDSLIKVPIPEAIVDIDVPADLDQLS